MIDIDKLERIAREAGGEMWSTESGPSGTFDGLHVWHQDGDSVCRVYPHIGHMPNAIDEEQIAAHITANSPAAVLELIAEVRALRGMIARIPQTSQAMIEFVGSNYNAMSAKEWTDELPQRPLGNLDEVVYSLSVHDLLGAFSWSGLGSDDINSELNAE
jgi:hypothetical protein